ncbi:MAG: site-specific integrase [Candidatus Acidiferrum sp.]
MVRRQHAEKLCEYSDRYRCKKDVKPLLDAKLKPLNEGSCSAESTLAVAEYVEKYFLPYAERELKPSTVYGYRGVWRMYLKPRLASIALRDFRCVDATNLLAAIHEHHRLGRTTLKHLKALLSSIFRHAKQAGVLDGANPVTDAGIPRAAVAGKPTHAYSVEEVMLMLSALTGVARTAVALMFFCALRPGEARAARWDDYNRKTKTLRIRSSMWRSHLTEPKTRESAAAQIVPETLADIFAESPSNDGYILKSPLGQPIDLYNLTSRVIVPALARCATCHKENPEHPAIGHEFQPLPRWHGFYALRRGMATLTTSVDGQMAAKSLLRHANISTTQQFYIKSVPSEALRAVEKIDALFQKSAAGAAPN